MFFFFFPECKLETVGLIQASVSRIIDNVVNVLCEMASRDIKMPTNDAAINRIVLTFSRVNDFPRAIGCVDGTHVPIKTPYRNEEIFINRKQYHSLNIQVGKTWYVPSIHTSPSSRTPLKSLLT